MKKACCLLLALALLCAALPAFAAETAELGKPFHDFTVTTIDGEEFIMIPLTGDVEVNGLRIRRKREDDPSAPL